MKTLIAHYQEINPSLKSQLEAANTPETVAKIVQDEINKLSDINSDYIQSLTPPQARLAKAMLQSLNQYTNILTSVKIQDLNPEIPETAKNQLEINELTSKVISPINKVIETQKNIYALTTANYYKQAFLQQAQQSRVFFSSLVAGGLAGILEGGIFWGLLGTIIGGITGGVFSKIAQEKQLSKKSEIPKYQVKTSINIEKLLEHIYQALQSIDLTITAYGGKEDKAPKSGLENNLDLLEYLQDLLADALDEKTQLPISVRRRIEQATTILRRYGIEARVYQPSQEQDLMFYFEPSIDPEIKSYTTIKHALMKGDQIILPGYVVEPI
jgi:hypothetical protein